MNPAYTAAQRIPAEVAGVLQWLLLLRCDETTASYEPRLGHVGVNGNQQSPPANDTTPDTAQSSSTSVDAAAPASQISAAPLPTSNKQSGSDVASDNVSGPRNADADDDFAVWAVDEFDSSRLAEAQRRLAGTGPALTNAYWRNTYATKAGRYWDQFYQRNADRFFKERNYLERDFPMLLQAAGRERLTLLEFGCGTGAAFYPLVSRLPHLYVTAFDLSRHAVDIIKNNELYKTGRVCAFAHDATAPDIAAVVRQVHSAFAAERSRDNDDCVNGSAASAANGAVSVANTHLDAASALQSHPLYQRGFDAVLMLFMLSAMAPEVHAGIIRSAAACLRPGGHLLFRDYGMWDEAQLRFGKGHKLDDNLFVRQDGTLAYYFTTTELCALAASAGLEVADCRYLYRRYTNRAEGNTLRRVFVHAVFRKPAESTCTLPFW